MFRRIQMLWIYRAHQLLLTESKGGDGRSQSQTKNLSRSNERPQSAEVTQAHSMTRGFHHQITLVGRCYCYTYKRILKLARHQQANRFGGSMLQNLVRVFFFFVVTSIYIGSPLVHAPLLLLQANSSQRFHEKFPRTCNFQQICLS